MKVIDFMDEALREAQKAERMNEVPIGAVVVKDGIIIGRGHNTRENSEQVLGHAELVAIHQAAQYLGDWRLTDCDIYVTLEPCPMCCGALFQSRIRTIYYGASDRKSGACGGLFDFFSVKGLNHYCNVEGGIKEEQCKSLLKKFFINRR